MPNWRYSCGISDCIFKPTRVSADARPPYAAQCCIPACAHHALNYLNAASCMADVIARPLEREPASVSSRVPLPASKAGTFNASTGIYHQRRAVGQCRNAWGIGQSGARFLEVVSGSALSPLRLTLLKPYWCQFVFAPGPSGPVWGWRLRVIPGFGAISDGLTTVFKARCR